MPVFKKHYTLEEARALLPLVRQWLQELTTVRELLQNYEEQLGKALGAGDDLGGELVNKHVKCLAAVKQVMLRFQSRDIHLKDPDRGLVDFPAYRAGKEVFLCWELGEEDIEFWHDLSSGYGGRERL